MRVVILIPLVDNSGPIKGAIALAKGLKNHGHSIELVEVFGEHRERSEADLKVFGLGKTKNIFSKIKAIKKHFWKEGSRTRIISFCAYPDLLVWMSGLSDFSVSSLRGNLYKNYFYDKGILGLVLAFVHYWIASNHAVVTVLNNSMLETVSRFSTRVRVIPNFIDEVDLHRSVEKSEAFRLIFVGGLTKRKRLEDLLDAIAKLRHRKLIHLTILGDGPLKSKIARKVKAMGLRDVVSLKGNVIDPYKYLLEADLFVLPSLSEGTPRAALEALHSGVPIILRDVDSNHELVSAVESGRLFRTKKELYLQLESSLESTFIGPWRESLIPPQFSQAICTAQYDDIIMHMEC